jgi:hypothetical protein
MTASVLEIIRQIEQAGGRMALDGERVRYRLPAGFQEPEATVALLRLHRAEVVRLLRERQNHNVAKCGSPESAGCYEIEAGRRIHPPRASAEWEAWLKRWEPKGKVQ